MKTLIQRKIKLENAVFRKASGPCQFITDKAAMNQCEIGAPDQTTQTPIPSLDQRAAAPAKRAVG